MLRLKARADLEVMAMKGYSAFTKALTLLEPHLRTLVGGMLPLCRDAVSVFYNPS